MGYQIDRGAEGESVIVKAKGLHYIEAWDTVG